MEKAAVTVTVVPDAPSETLDGFADRLIFGGPSLSSSLTLVPFTVIPVEEPATERVSLPSTCVSSVGVSVNVAVPLPAPAAMVTLKSVTAA